MGKLSAENLTKLLQCIKPDPTVVIPPRPGFDSGVHKIGDKYLVISTDPCIGVPQKWFGWLLLNYAASDVALFGARPKYGTVDILGSSDTSPATFERIMSQACQAADEIGMTIVTGHTGRYRPLPEMVGVCTAYGIISKNELITPAGVQPSDLILCTKPIGLEVAVNFAIAQKDVAEDMFGTKRTHELKGLVKMQSCVKEALLLAGKGYVNAMHDATEGGLTAALNEIAEASHVGLTLEFERIPFVKDTDAMKHHFRLSETELLSISSTGTIIAAVKPETLDRLKKELAFDGVSPSVIGVFTEDPKRCIVKNGRKRKLPKTARDPYERILSGQL